MGYQDIYLLVSCENLIAIQLYMKFNFTPILEDENEVIQWNEILNKIKIQSNKLHRKDNYFNQTLIPCNQTNHQLHKQIHDNQTHDNQSDDGDSKMRISYNNWNKLLNNRIKLIISKPTLFLTKVIKVTPPPPVVLLWCGV